MRNCIGIRAETKDPLERRSPLTPAHVGRLVRRHRLRVVVQPSPNRVYTADEFTRAGATLSTDLRRCNVIFGVKEVPEDELLPRRAYCFFSHTIKAQPYNMPMLARILERRNTLLDYELIKNAAGRRLVAFGRFAGQAGMIDSLWALGRRLAWEGIPNPFERLRRPLEYEGLKEAEGAITEIGTSIKRSGLPPAIAPLVCAITGQGRVSRGASRILRLLPTNKVRQADLPELFARGRYSNRAVYRVELTLADLFEPRVAAGRFDWYHYRRYPERFTSRLARYLPYYSVLVNGIYWEPRYPRLVTRDRLRSLFGENPNARLKVIGDISCDVEGSVEATLKATPIDAPVYVYEPGRERAVDGIAGVGPVIMAVDKLPTELPRESSEAFADALLPFVPALARARFDRSLQRSGLPHEFLRATIAHDGRLTPDFEFLASHLPRRRASTRH